jgi:hypothetical protein
LSPVDANLGLFEVAFGSKVMWQIMVEFATLQLFFA